MWYHGRSKGNSSQWRSRISNRNFSRKKRILGDKSEWIGEVEEEEDGIMSENGRMMTVNVVILVFVRVCLFVCPIFLLLLNFLLHRFIFIMLMHFFFLLTSYLPHHFSSSALLPSFVILPACKVTSYTFTNLPLFLSCIFLSIIFSFIQLLPWILSPFRLLLPSTTLSPSHPFPPLLPS